MYPGQLCVGDRQSGTVRGEVHPLEKTAQVIGGEKTAGGEVVAQHRGAARDVNNVTAAVVHHVEALRRRNEVPGAGKQNGGAGRCRYVAGQIPDKGVERAGSIVAEVVALRKVMTPVAPGCVSGLG